MTDISGKATRSRLRVRAVILTEVPRVVDFLRAQFVSHIPANELMGLFNYSWRSGGEKPTLGFALWSEERLVGFLGCIYAVRFVKGKFIRTCNLSTWYVQEPFRYAAMQLLYAALAQKDYWISSLTPSPRVGEILEQLGFQALDRFRWVYLPWSFSGALLRKAPHVVSKPDSVRRVLDSEGQRVFDDHREFRLKHYVAQIGGEYTYIVLKRRSMPGNLAFPRFPVKKMRNLWYPAMEVLHVTNPIVAGRAWPDIVGAVIRREHVLGVYAGDHFLGESAPLGVRWNRTSYVLAREAGGEEIDSLYSELVLLRI